MAALLAAALLGAGLCLARPAVAEPQNGVAPPAPRASHSSTRVYVYPRRQPGPNSKRVCRSWLAREYRVSGPVIVPQMRCYWN